MDTSINSYGRDAVQDYAKNLGPIRVGDMLMEYNGDKGQLAQALADASGTKRASQMKNIDRWTAWEAGKRGSQARDPGKNKGTQGVLKNLFMKGNPPQGMTISITGFIGYTGGDFRLRTVNIDSSQYAINTGAFINAVNAGNAQAAYQAVFANYADLIVAQASHIDIQFS
jgi:hypothetical protein